MNKCSIGQSVFILFFQTHERKTKQESNSIRDVLFVASRDGSVYKMKVGITLEAGGSKICSLYLKSSAENGPEAPNTELIDQSNRNVDKEVFVTCHKEVDCGDKKIAIIGHSDGTLKLFDVSVPD